MHQFWCASLFVILLVEVLMLCFFQNLSEQGTGPCMHSRPYRSTVDATVERVRSGFHREIFTDAPLVQSPEDRLNFFLPAGAQRGTFDASIHVRVAQAGTLPIVANYVSFFKVLCARRTIRRAQCAKFNNRWCGNGTHCAFDLEFRISADRPRLRVTVTRISLVPPPQDP